MTNSKNLRQQDIENRSDWLIDHIAVLAITDTLGFGAVCCHFSVLKEHTNPGGNGTPS
jgi:hypothetical protein